MKVYQMTQEQVDLLSNDIIEVLQEILKVSEQLQEQNLEVKTVFDNEDKNNKLVQDIDYLTNSIGSLKNQMKNEFTGMIELNNSIGENLQLLQDMNKKLNKKSSNFQIPDTQKKNKILWFIGGIGLGIFLTISIFIYAHNGTSILSDTSNKTQNKIKEYIYEH
jgi:uncharacterized protein involved in exopolysaccharide biosynthesis